MSYYRNVFCGQLSRMVREFSIQPEAGNGEQYSFTRWLYEFVKWARKEMARKQAEQETIKQNYIAARSEA